MDNLKGILDWPTTVSRVPVTLATALQASGACWLLLVTSKVPYPVIVITRQTTPEQPGLCRKLTDLQVMQPVLRFEALLRFLLSGLKTSSDMIYSTAGPEETKSCKSLQTSIMEIQS